MTTMKVSLFGEGRMPPTTCTLEDLLREHPFDDMDWEEIREVFAAWLRGEAWMLGGGAAPLVAVRPWQAGDEERTLEDVLTFAPQCWGLDPETVRRTPR